MLVKYFLIFDEEIILFCDTAISHSNIDIRIVTKNIAVHRCIAAALVFHNRLVMLAVFGICLGAYPPLSLACSRLGGALAPPQLSLTHRRGGACASLVVSSVTLQGVSLPPLIHYSLLECVAATVIALLIITRVCRCHPSCSHFAGCVAATPILY